MTKKIILLIFLMLCNHVFAQIEALTEMFNVPVNLEETSGLIFYNNKLITHNDSGGDANLYELDTLTGLIDRTIVLNNAINEDWEDITQDENYIYIGDFGNNNGTRTNLKIYRIDKSDFLNSSNVNTDIISFSYEDQTDFSENGQTNYDAEAMVIINNNIIIFTKNWGNLETNVYSFSATTGPHVAINIGSYNVQGLITGATYNDLDSSIFLTGYDDSVNPFLIYLANFPGNSFFNGTVIKTDITPIIGQGSQIEGITNLNNERYIISREKLFSLIAKVYTFNSLYVLKTNDIHQNVVSLYPNPVSNKFRINSTNQIKKIEIYNSLGNKIFTQNKNFDSIFFDKFTNGIYFVKILLNNNKMISKTFIKV